MIGDAGERAEECPGSAGTAAEVTENAVRAKLGPGARANETKPPLEPAARRKRAKVGSARARARSILPHAAPRAIRAAPRRPTRAAGEFRADPLSEPKARRFNARERGRARGGLVLCVA